MENINNMTIGQFLELSRIFKGLNKNENCDLFSEMIGKYVIVRSRNEGVNCGYLVKADKNGCVLSEARRLWFHKPLDNSQSWYEGVANSGLSKDSKISGCVDIKVIVEDYSITKCSAQAEKSIKEHKTYES